jgi:hypothetical protein
MDRVFTIADIARSIYMLPQTLKYKVDRELGNEVGAKKGRQTVYTVDDVRTILEYLRVGAQNKVDYINMALTKLEGVPSL